MRRCLIALLALLAVASIGVAPSDAAVKKKHPDWKGSFSVTLYPDPTEDVLGLNGGCNGVSPKGKDVRPFTVPAAGTLTLHLVSPDPTNKGVTDWDIYLKAADDTYAGTGGDGGSSDEVLSGKFKKKETFQLQVCNLLGTPTATVSWVFKYA
jgi:hypothetical protein